MQIPINHSCTFTEVAEEKMKKIQAVRNKKFGYNDNRSVESTTRWIGLAGEVTLNDWFKKSPWAGQAHSHFKMQERDDADFDFGSLNIDVKIQRKINQPSTFDFCYVYEEQYERIMYAGITNTLVFGFYHIPSKTCSLIGFMTLRDFDDNKNFYEAGKPRTEKSRFPISTNEYSVSLYSALKKGILQPLQELDRYR